MQVRVELQADCFAGIFANHAQESKNIIEPGDIDETLNAASANRRRQDPKVNARLCRADPFTQGSSARASAGSTVGIRPGNSPMRTHVQYRP